MTREEILAYAAGIVDGEGCIMIGKGNSPTTRTGKRFTLAVWVANTEPWLLKWLEIQFGGHVCLHEDKRNKPNWKPCWQWYLKGAKATEFLVMIMPYLQLKQRQAELALEFSKGRSKGKPLGEKGSVLQQAQYILMRELNKRGVRNEEEV